MKHRSSLISAIVAILVLTILQAPSSALMPTSLSKATGMSTVQIKKMIANFDTAFDEASAIFLADASAGKAKVTDSTLTSTGVLTVSKRHSCSLGGYVNTAMSETVVLTKSTDVLSASFVINQTIANWKCLSGWTVNGTRRYAYRYSGLRGKTMQVTGGTLSGGWKSTGPNKAKQSCKVAGKVANDSSGTGLTAKVNISCVPGSVITMTEKL